MSNDVNGWLPGLIGPLDLQTNGTDVVARRVVWNFNGFRITDDLARLNFTIEGFAGDADGIATITATEVLSDGDAFVKPISKIGHVATANATPVEVVLFTLTDPEVLRLDAIVTATNEDASINATYTLRALATYTGGTPAISGGTDATPVETDAGLNAALSLDGEDVILTVTGLAATDLVFGYEIRAQRQRGI